MARPGRDTPDGSGFSCLLRKIGADAACRLQLFKLVVERLPVRADAGITNDAILLLYFGHNFRQA